MNEIKFPILSDEIIPHRNSMQLLYALTECEIGRAKGISRISRKSVFCDAKSVCDEIVGIELMAQLSAAYKGYLKRKKDERYNIGFLVGIKDFLFHEKLNVDDEIETEARIKLELDKAFIVEGEVRQNGELKASGIITVWDEDKPFDAGIEKNECNAENKNKDIFLDLISLKNPLNTISEDVLKSLRTLSLEKNDDEEIIQGEYYFSDKFHLFQGHFPGFPILPGIILIKSVFLPINLLMHTPHRIDRIQNIKFLSPIFPNQSFKFITHVKKDNNKCIIKSKLTSGNKNVANLSMTAVEF